MGWAILANPHTHFEPQYVASGTYGLIRHGEGKDAEPWQEYKLRLIEHFTIKSGAILYKYRPLVLISEIQPAVGGGNYVAATQAELAKTSSVVFQSAFYREGLKVVQYGSNTIKKILTGDSGASKVKVRNAVIKFFPELAENKQRWQANKDGFDEPDAIGIALVYWMTKEYV